MVTTGVYGSGVSRSIGFALGAPGGLVVYRQSILGPIHAPAQAGTAAFSELHVVVYASALTGSRPGGGSHQQSAATSGDGAIRAAHGRLHQVADRSQRRPSAGRIGSRARLRG